ncbi:hypothetical protein BP5796_13160 [Coleophoma crateriformis]|uniref:Short-chain dehydrogenase n=1 Tax=Coleophoma crateriformis TaxID=565419 RepID=A0A3D8Q3U5_9HELO|nr:hypothetical protein BP5796_13160 [Coleophoma crateriformis]
MTATTHPEFNGQTEGLEVAKAFAEAIHGKTVVVTGVNRGGIGFSTSEAIASQSPAQLIIAGRNLSKIQECIDALKTQFPDVHYRPLHINLSSQQSVRTAASDLLFWSDVKTIDILVNNAGICLLPERTISENGIEMHFATNHIGHFLFTCLVMPKLIKATEGSPKGATRIINVSSGSPIMASMRWSDLNFEKKTKDLPETEKPSYRMHTAWGTEDLENKSYIPLEAYNQSKVANVLFGIAANKRLYKKYGILSLALHPGVIKTELGRNASPETLAAVRKMMEKGEVSYRTLGAGASTSLVAALDPKLGVGKIGAGGGENYGAFLVDCQISDKAHPLAVSSEEAEKLWELSEELVKERFA